MNILNFIYMIGAFAVGLLIGMIVELMLDARTIRELQDDNRRLRLQLRQLELENKKLKKVEVIEINDNSLDPDNVPSYSQNW